MFYTTTYSNHGKTGSSSDISRYKGKFISRKLIQGSFSYTGTSGYGTGAEYHSYKREIKATFELKQD